MTRAADMLDSTPATFDFDRDALAECIAACFECAQTCTACADACLSESNVADLVRCIRLDLDCADVCEATGRVLSRQTAYDATLTRAVLEACATACKSCGDECAQHAEHGMKHCQVLPRRAAAASRPAAHCCPPPADQRPHPRVRSVVRPSSGPRPGVTDPPSSPERVRGLSRLWRWSST